jgi:hypothetical protein
MSTVAHENLSREEPVKIGSDRSFGITMAVVFALLSLYGWWAGGSWWLWTCAAGGLLLALGLFYPPALGPLNHLWFRFGLLLHKVVNPLVMALMFFGAVLPTGLIMRALGRDLLRLKLDPLAQSYWIRRQPPGPAPDTMKDQF